MGKKQKYKKRPCRICGKWFTPNARLGDRQQTCGAKECKRKWHIKKCAKWNRKNRIYFREIYLVKRLENSRAGPPENSTSKHPSSGVKVPPPGSIFPNLPQRVVQEVIGAQQLIIIEYIARLLMRGVQDVIKAQHTGKQKELRELPLSSISRGNSQKPP